VKPVRSYLVPVGDEPGHSFVLAKTACTWTRPIEIGGITTKDGADVAAQEIRGNRSVDSGSHWSAMSNGDRIFVRLHGTTMFDNDRQPRSASGRWSFTGGTGRMNGIIGNGTYSGKSGADGSMTYEIEGQYKLPSEAAPPTPAPPFPPSSFPPAGASRRPSPLGRRKGVQFPGAAGSTFAPR
jgi:hypothetical protein